MLCSYVLLKDESDSDRRINVDQLKLHVSAGSVSCCDAVLVFWSSLGTETWVWVRRDPVLGGNTCFCLQTDVFMCQHYY